MKIHNLAKPFPRYDVLGECNQCGACCENEDCEFFNEDKTCAIYGKPERPLKCVLWPEMPPVMFEKCGHSFYDKWEDRVVGYGDKL